MVDRPTNRLSAFSASNMPEPEPDRLQMLANSGRRQSANVEDVRDTGRLARTAEMFRTLPGIFRDLYSTYTTPWQYRDLPDRLSEISALLPRQDIPPMRPSFANGGSTHLPALLLAYQLAPFLAASGARNIDDILSIYSKEHNGL